MRIYALTLCLLVNSAFALNWTDLWQTKDQQAQRLMQKKQYKEAVNTFEREDWAGVAAYRAGDYKQALESFAKSHREQSYYNLGNALAHTGEYEKAIAAYDNALAINPKNQDALFNRKLVKDLMKKDKEKQDKQNQQSKDQQNKDQQNKDQQNKDQQNKDQQNKDQQNKDQQNKDQQNKDQQNKDQQNKDQQNKDQQNKDQQNKDRQNKDQQNKDRQNKDQQNKDQQKQDKQKKEQQKEQEQKSRSKQEDQAAKEQWLKLVPDDPGGLMRQKFLRDYLRRQDGWY